MTFDPFWTAVGLVAFVALPGLLSRAEDKL